MGKEGQGFITNEVLKEILQEIDSTLSEEDLEGIIEEVDEDGSGTMDFDEFQEMIMGWSSHKNCILNHDLTNNFTCVYYSDYKLIYYSFSTDRILLMLYIEVKLPIRCILINLLSSTSRSSSVNVILNG